MRIAKPAYMLAGSSTDLPVLQPTKFEQTLL
jgi:hypothetical protein